MKPLDKRQSDKSAVRSAQIGRIFPLGAPMADEEPYARFNRILPEREAKPRRSESAVKPFRC